MGLWDRYATTNRREALYMSGAASPASLAEKYGAEMLHTQLQYEYGYAEGIRSKLVDDDIRRYQELTGQSLHIPYDPGIRGERVAPAIGDKESALINALAKDPETARYFNTDYDGRVRERYDTIKSEIESVRERTPEGFLSDAVGFAGATTAFFKDPATIGATIASAPIVAGGRLGLAAFLGREFAVNAGVSAVTVPTAVKQSKYLGEEYGFTEGLIDIVGGGAAGAGFAAGGRAFSSGARAVREYFRPFDIDISDSAANLYMANRIRELQTAPVRPVDAVDVADVLGRLDQITYTLRSGGVVPDELVRAPDLQPRYDLAQRITTGTKQLVDDLDPALFSAGEKSALRDIADQWQRSYEAELPELSRASTAAAADGVSPSTQRIAQEGDEAQAAVAELTEQITLLEQELADAHRGELGTLEAYRADLDPVAYQRYIDAQARVDDPQGTPQSRAQARDELARMKSVLQDDATRAIREELVDTRRALNEASTAQNAADAKLAKSREYRKLRKQQAKRVKEMQSRITQFHLAPESYSPAVWEPDAIELRSAAVRSAERAELEQAMRPEVRKVVEDPNNIAGVVDGSDLAEMEFEVRDPLTEQVTKTTVREAVEQMHREQRFIDAMEGCLSGRL